MPAHYRRARRAPRSTRTRGVHALYRAVYRSTLSLGASTAPQSAGRMAKAAHAPASCSPKTTTACAASWRARWSGPATRWSPAPTARGRRGAGRRLHLLLTDIVMPGMDGIEVARIAAARQPALRIMFITGFAAVALSAGEPRPGRRQGAGQARPPARDRRRGGADDRRLTVLPTAPRDLPLTLQSEGDRAWAGASRTFPTSRAASPSSPAPTPGWATKRRWRWPARAPRSWSPRAIADKGAAAVARIRAAHPERRGPAGAARPGEPGQRRRLRGRASPRASDSSTS